MQLQTKLASLRGQPLLLDGVTYNVSKSGMLGIADSARTDKVNGLLEAMGFAEPRDGGDKARIVPAVTKKGFAAAKECIQHIRADKGLIQRAATCHKTSDFLALAKDLGYEFTMPQYHKAVKEVDSVIPSKEMLTAYDEVTTPFGQYRSSDLEAVALELEMPIEVAFVSLFGLAFGEEGARKFDTPLTSAHIRSLLIDAARAEEEAEAAEAKEEQARVEREEKAAADKKAADAKAAADKKSAADKAAKEKAAKEKDAADKKKADEEAAAKTEAEQAPPAAQPVTKSKPAKKASKPKS